MLTAYAWFSIGMGVTAMMTTTTMFGLLRFITGLGVGALVATTGALVSEFAPPGKKNLCNAITYSGVPLGSLLAAFLAILLLDSIGWRGHVLDRGAAASSRCCRWPSSRCPSRRPGWPPAGRIDEARAISERTGRSDARGTGRRTRRRRAASARGFAGLFSRELLVAHASCWDS